MTTDNRKTIKLNETTRMRVLDLGDKQICVRVEVDQPKPRRGKASKRNR